jgi:hypothetical protein
MSYNLETIVNYFINALRKPNLYKVNLKNKNCSKLLEYKSFTMYGIILYLTRLIHY